MDAQILMRADAGQQASHMDVVERKLGTWELAWGSGFLY